MVGEDVDVGLSVVTGSVGVSVSCLDGVLVVGGGVTGAVVGLSVG